VRRGAKTMFNEQKHSESTTQRLQSEVHRANNAVDKMRDEVILLWSKNSDLREERSGLKRQQENDKAENQTAFTERDSTIADLRSLLERCNKELDGLERSIRKSIFFKKIIF
jgi:predicted RNase H-like nuclease (RuvC/YqgF family)